MLHSDSVLDHLRQHSPVKLLNLMFFRKSIFVLEQEIPKITPAVKTVCRNETTVHSSHENTNSVLRVLIGCSVQISGHITQRTFFSVYFPSFTVIIAALIAGLVHSHPEVDENEPFDSFEKLNALIRCNACSGDKRNSYDRPEISDTDSVQPTEPNLFFSGKRLAFLRVEGVVPVFRCFVQAVNVIRDFFRAKELTGHCFNRRRSKSVFIVCALRINLFLRVGFRRGNSQNIFKNGLVREFSKQELDVVVALFPGIRKVHDPMSPQKLIVGKRLVLIAAQLVINLFPCPVDLLPERGGIILIQVFFFIKSCKVDQPVLQQLKIRQPFSTVVHGFEGNKHIVVIFNLMNIEHQLQCQLAVEICQSVAALNCIEFAQFFGKEKLRPFQILGVIRFPDRSAVFLPEDFILQILRARIVILIPEKICGNKTAGRHLPTDILGSYIPHNLIAEKDLIIAFFGILRQ